MPLYGGDYLRDTMHLTAAQDGIYMRLLMHYWHSQRPLPAERRKIEGIARCQGEAELGCLDQVLSEFFQKRGNEYHNARMDREIAKAIDIKRKLSEAGLRGAEARLKPGRSLAVARHKQSIAIAIATTKANPKATAKAVSGDTPEPPTPSATAAPRGANGVAVWEAYAKAFKTRYKVEPVRNAKVNAQLEQLVKRLGAEEAPAVATFYLSHNSPAYIHRGHSVGMLLLDAEKLRTEWASGRKITSAEARGAEQRDSVSEQARRVSERMDMKHGQQ